MLNNIKKNIINFFCGDTIELLIKNTILLGLVAILALLSSLIKDSQFSDNIFLKIYVFLEFVYIIIFALLFGRMGI